jgi:hypothetical protein
MIRLSKLFLINIKNYGYLNSLKILLFEIIGFIQFFNYKEFSFIEENKTSYSSSKKLNTYNTAYIPTPYYFLYLINEHLKFKKMRQCKFIDLGCGYSRPANYFISKQKKIDYLGIDIYKYDRNKKKSYKILKQDLRNFKKTKIILDKFIKKDQNNVIFLSDPFDIKLVFKILNFLNLKKKKFFTILVNVNTNIVNRDFKLIYLKKFNQRNIKIYKN